MLALNLQHNRGNPLNPDDYRVCEGSARVTMLDTLLDRKKLAAAVKIATTKEVQQPESSEDFDDEAEQQIAFRTENCKINIRVDDGLASWNAKANILSHSRGSFICACEFFADGRRTTKLLRGESGRVILSDWDTTFAWHHGRLLVFDVYFLHPQFRRRNTCVITCRRFNLLAFLLHR